MNLCMYKNIFGKVTKGVHSYRFFNLAMVDVIMTLIGGLIISKLSRITKSSYYHLSFIQTTIGLFILGIIMHRLFCVRTTIDKLLFE